MERTTAWPEAEDVGELDAPWAEDAVQTAGLTRTDGPEPEAAGGPDGVSVVLPVFDEEDNLAPLLAEIHAALEPLERPWEVVAVDDGSRDGSLDRLRDLAASEPRLRILSTPRRSGQSAALAAGLRAARAPVIVTLDADLQNDPRDIPRLLAALDGREPGAGETGTGETGAGEPGSCDVGCDVVSGVRETRRDGWVRRVSSRLANGVRRRVLDDGVHDVGCSLKAYRREVLEDLPVFQGMHRFLPALVRFRGARVREIPVHHRPRRFGRSKYGIGNRLGRGLLDLFGVWWLKRRHLDLSLYAERLSPSADETEPTAPHHG